MLKRGYKEKQFGLQDSIEMVWRTRKRGTIRQRGQKFKIGTPVFKRRYGHLPLKKVKLVPPKEFLVKTILDKVLNKTPVREIYLWYKIADSVYDKWSSIKELYNKYEKEGLPGLIDSKTTHDILSSIQTNIIWRIVEDYVPKGLQGKGFAILSNIIDKITDEEIRYVKASLQRT